MRKLFTPARILYIWGFIITAIAVFMDLSKGKFDFVSFIPNIRYIEAGLNALCSVLCIFLIINPELHSVLYTVLILEATSKTYIGFTGIGTMVAIFLVLNLFANGFFKKHLKRRIALLLVWWAIVLISLLPNFGLRGFILCICLSFLYCAMLLAIYDKLKEKLAYLVTQEDTVQTSVNLPKKGSVLFLHDYNLTERQIKFLLSAIKEGLSYEQISNQNNISVSVVKKEMVNCCQIFGVKNKEDLKILLLQYRLLP